MLGCKGFIFRHLRMMYSVVIVWPMGLYWYCVPYHKKLFPGLWRCKVFFLGKMLLTVNLLASFLWGQFASSFAQVRRDYSQYGALHSSNMAFDVGRLNFRLFWNWVLNIWKEPLIVIWRYKINSSEWKKVDEWVSQIQFTVHGFNTSGAKIIQKSDLMNWS